MNSITGESVTVKITKETHYGGIGGAFIKQGQVFVINTFGKKQYNIVKKDSKEKDVWDEEFGDSFETRVTLKPLSKWLIIRKIQIVYYRIKFKLNSVTA